MGPHLDYRPAGISPVDARQTGDAEAIVGALPVAAGKSVDHNNETEDDLLGKNAEDAHGIESDGIDPDEHLVVARNRRPVPVRHELVALLWAAKQERLLLLHRDDSDGILCGFSGCSGGEAGDEAHGRRRGKRMGRVIVSVGSLKIARTQSESPLSAIDRACIDV